MHDDDVGRYQIEGVKGRGVFGVVYRARDRMTGRPCAVKMLAPTSERALQRFARECAALTRLRHPNIVSMIDSGATDEGRPYLVLEWIDGATVSEALVEGPFPLHRAGSIIRQIADALATIHANGFVHRDLKSNNIMLRDVRGRELACVLDFGMVRDWTSDWTRLTRLGQATGTPLYAAPECLFGREITPKADLYSLGIILYEMLIGSVPWRPDSFAELLDIDRNDVPHLIECGPFAELVHVLLRPDPAQRPSSAARVLQLLPAPDDRTTVLHRTFVPPPKPRLFPWLWSVIRPNKNKRQISEERSRAHHRG